MKKSILILAGVGLLAASAALASEPYFPRSQKSFDRIDADRDGKIEKPEFMPTAFRSLTRMDVNGDRAVTSAEIDARLLEGVQRRRERTMAVMDTNKDGTITESELDKLVVAMFNGADSDKDGGLSMAELKGFKRSEWRKAYLVQEQTAAAGGN